MKVSTQADALKQKMFGLTESQISAVLLNVGEHIGTNEIDPLIDHLFWMPKFRTMSSSDFYTEVNRLQDWFGPEAWHKKDRFVTHVNEYFAKGYQPADSDLVS